MNKKIISYLMIFALLIMQLGTIHVSADITQTEKATLYSDAIKAEAGKTIQVPVYIKNNPGIMGAGIQVQYDEEAFTPVSVTAGKLMSSGVLNDSIETSKTNQFKVVWASSENMTENGTLFIISFAVSEYVRGSHEIRLTSEQQDTFNELWEDVELEGSVIHVDISDPVYEEANISGKYEDTVACGSKAVIPISISNNSSVTEAEISIKYDKDVFSHVKVTSALADKCEFKEISNGIQVNLSGIETSKETKTLMSLTFDVADYTGGQFDFTLESDDVIATGFQVTVQNTHGKESAIVYAGQVQYGTDGTIDVPVCIKNNPGIMGYKMTVTYDDQILEPVSASAGEKYTGNFDDNIANRVEQKKNNYQVLWTGTEDVTGIGTLFTARFKVLSETNKETKLVITYSQNDTFNEQYQDVELDISDMVINTMDTIPSTSPSGKPSTSPSVSTSGKPSALPSGKPTGSPSGRPGGQTSADPGKTPDVTTSSQPDGQPGIPAAEPSGQPEKTPGTVVTPEPGNQKMVYVVCGEFTGWGGKDSYPSSVNHEQGDGEANFYYEDQSNMVTGKGYGCGLELMNPYNDLFTGASNEMAVFTKKMVQPVVKVTLKNGGEASSWNWNTELKFPSGKEVALPKGYLDSGYFALFGNDDVIIKVEIYDSGKEMVTEKPAETKKPDPSAQPSNEPATDPSAEPNQPVASAGPAGPGNVKDQTGQGAASAPTPQNSGGNDSKKTVKAPSRPAKVKIKKVSALKKGKVKITWKKVTGADFYAILYSTKKNFKGARVGISYGKKAQLRLKKKKTYYIRIRACVYGNSANNYKTVRGKWSKVKKVRTKG